MSDTHAACMNFVNALEKIPGIISQYEERTAKLKADVPQLEAIISKPWGKEDELKQLKSELAPKHEEKDDEEVKLPPDIQGNKTHEDCNTTAQKEKAVLVAEPIAKYSYGSINNRRFI